MCLCTVCWCLIYCSHLHFGFSILSKGNESPNIKFTGAAALKADTAGCQELFKLALLLTWRHTNKQFNHSSQNMSWHVVTFPWDGVTSFLLWRAAGGRASLMWISRWEGRGSTAHLLLFSNPVLSVTSIKCECPRWRFADFWFNKCYGNIFVIKHKPIQVPP